MGEHELQQNQNKKRNLSPLSNSNSKKTRMQIVPDTGSSEIEAELKKKKLKVPLMNTRVERNKVRKVKNLLNKQNCLKIFIYLGWRVYFGARDNEWTS